MVEKQTAAERSPYRVFPEQVFTILSSKIQNRKRRERRKGEEWFQSQRNA